MITEKIKEKWSNPFPPSSSALNTGIGCLIKDTMNCPEKAMKTSHLNPNQSAPSIYIMIELCYFSLDQWEIRIHLLWGKCFNIPHHCDPHLNQTKFNDLLPLTIDGVLVIVFEFVYLSVRWAVTFLMLNCQMHCDTCCTFISWLPLWQIFRKNLRPGLAWNYFAQTLRQIPKEIPSNFTSLHLTVVKNITHVIILSDLTLRFIISCPQ